MMIDDLLDYMAKTPVDKWKMAVPNRLAIAEFLALAQSAERFDFGALHTEAVEDVNFGGMPAYKMPEITDEEYGFWYDGLIPLPSPVSWYEFSVNDVRSGLMVTELKRGLLTVEQDDGIWTQRIEFGKNQPMMIDGTWVQMDKTFGLKLVNNDPQLMVRLNALDADKCGMMYGSSCPLIIYFSLMLNSKSTDVRRIEPTKEQTKLRRQLGRAAPSPYTRVTIIPARYYRDAREHEGTKEARKSPCMHWRRSHVRTINEGEPNEKKILIARQIIARRELPGVPRDHYVVKRTREHAPDSGV